MSQCTVCGKPLPPSANCWILGLCLSPTRDCYKRALEIVELDNRNGQFLVEACERMSQVMYFDGQRKLMVPIARKCGCPIPDKSLRISDLLLPHFETCPQYRFYMFPEDRRAIKALLNSACRRLALYLYWGP